MEETYPVESYPYVSQSFKCNDYFVEYKKVLSETLYKQEAELETKSTTLEKIACMMGISLSECTDLEQKCSISQLENVNEPVDPLELKLRSEAMSADDKLEKATRTLATAVELKAIKAHPLQYEKKLRDLKKMSIPTFKQEPNPSPEVKLPKEFVMIARVFRPFRSHMGSHTVAHAQDFMLLGSQNLVDFRDKIKCMNDDLPVGEAGPIKDHIKSGMFFFGNTFYYDGRVLTNINYGEVIERWAKEKPEMKLGPFENRDMAECKIADLEIRLGFPYVFMHLGSCEHLVTFLDARLMDPEDLQNPDEYPLVVETENEVMYCFACDVHDSSYYVDDDQMPTKPVNLCEQCFEVFYKRNGVIPPSTEEVYYCKFPGKATIDEKSEEVLESSD